MKKYQYLIDDEDEDEIYEEEVKIKNKLFKEKVKKEDQRKSVKARKERRKEIDLKQKELIITKRIILNEI